MSKILVVDDEKALRDVLEDILKSQGYSVRLAKDGQEAIDLLEEEAFDLILLDVMMPKMDGWSVLREVRNKDNVPVIMLTARNLENDEVFGFELGADEYITKPFRNSILLARVKAVLKRSGIFDEIQVYEYKCLTLDKRAVKVFVNQEPIALSHTEFELLSILVQNEGIAMSREQLLDKVWGLDYFGGVRTVDTHIKRLRNKLKDASKNIKTIRGVGYRFEGDVIDD
ncbi:response regulator transcription factor [Fusibacter sp. JL216-2]|uniref:response regulator transcription factor n=1 Tax=Fusibacter sp. JL216-2 TaxID=3071453 RepID=UPI003D335175